MRGDDDVDAMGGDIRGGVWCGCSRGGEGGADKVIPLRIGVHSIFLCKLGGMIVPYCLG